MAVDWQGAAALIVAVGGAIAAIFGGLRALRGDRFRQDVEESTALLTGYRDMVASLRVELDNVRQSLAAERVSWNGERKELYKEIDGLRESMLTERMNWGNERQALHAEVEDLRKKVAHLMARRSTTRTRETDG